MRLSLIVAMDERRGIGYRGHLPWRLPADLRRFKSLTMGHHLVMGRKTYESIGRPLPGRTMIVLTRSQDYSPSGCLVAHSLPEALEIACQNGDEEVFVIGGGEVFDQALPHADRIYLTRVHATREADVFFPEFDPADWHLISSEDIPADEVNKFPFTFQLLEKRLS
jgi:dihydrofolate reductase